MSETFLVLSAFAIGAFAAWWINKNNNERKIVTALENLTGAINAQASETASLAAAVDDAVTHIGNPGATDQQLALLQAIVESNTATVTANTARLVAAVTPPTTVP